MPKRVTTEEFIKKCHKVHGDKYDYSKTEYKNSYTKVCITCPKHGEFWQRPDIHLRGSGCPKCSLDSMKRSLSIAGTKEEFIEKARLIHSGRYDYSKVDFTDSNTMVCIICPKHGEFWQTPHSHLKGHGCRKCFSESQRLSTEVWVDRAKRIHGDKYDYSKTEYITQKDKVCIICPEHGEFWQLPSGHLEGKGCYFCGLEKTKIGLTSSSLEFIKKAKEIHGDKYDYSKTEYRHNQQKVCITCPKHGEFWQTPNNHIGSSNECGCPKCNSSKLERFIMKILDDENIDYIFQCNFKHFKWLGRQKLDFYIPSLNMAIECQGLQHFKPVSFTKSKSAENDKINNLKYNIKNDEKKFKKCLDNNVKIIYVIDKLSYLNESVIYKYNNVYDKNEILEFLKNEKYNN